MTVATVAACAQQARPAAPGAAVGTRLDSPVASRIAHLRLTDSTGAATSLARYAGKVVVISDVMTLCQESCPLDTANLVAAARAADAAGLAGRVVFLSITVDPRRDTTAQLAAYRRLYAPAPANWHTLTGPAASLAALWKYLGVYYQRVREDDPHATNWRTGHKLTYDIDHADELFFLDPHGHERFVMSGPGHVEAGSLPAPMRSYLDTTGRRNLTHPGGDTWTVSQSLQALAWLTGQPIPTASADRSG